MWCSILWKHDYQGSFCVNAPSQWKTTLQCNVIFHWLGVYKKWSLFTTRCFAFHSLCSYFWYHLRITPQPHLQARYGGALVSLTERELWHWNIRICYKNVNSGVATVPLLWQVSSVEHEFLIFYIGSLVNCCLLVSVVMLFQFNLHRIVSCCKFSEAIPCVDSLEAGIILGIGSTNERQCYIVTSSLIDWTHTQNDQWEVTSEGFKASGFLARHRQL